MTLKSLRKPQALKKSWRKYRKLRAKTADVRKERSILIEGFPVMMA